MALNTTVPVPRQTNSPANKHAKYNDAENEHLPQIITNKYEGQSLMPKVNK